MRVLVLCDDHWHPASVVRAGLKGLEERGFEFDWVEDASDWSAERIAEYPVVLLSKSDKMSADNDRSWVSEKVQRAFVEHVRAGWGLLAVHSGTVYAQVPEMRRLLGGAFVRHPEQCPVTVKPQEGHPLTAGSVPFTALDEHYFVDLDDAEADVFMTTRSEHGTQPGGWTRQEGKGRVCVLTPGHNVEVWQQPSFQALLDNALRWCGETLEA
jgi:type 1 glutamine amidotransferase